MITEERRIGEQLRGRILSAFPAGHYALDTFFKLADVVISKEIDTAAVECVAIPRLLLNEKFITKHCKTDEHLFMLVMHELHHVLLGHTRLFQRHTMLDNIAFDAVINAILCQLFPEPTYSSFFQRLYAPDKLPDAVLRPPDGWPEKWNIPESLPKAAREIIRVLYSQASGTYKEVFDLFKNDEVLKKMLSQGQEGGESKDGQGKKGNNNKIGGTILLGDHSPEETPGRGESAANHPALNGAVREIVEKWPMPPEPIRGRSVGSDIRDIFLKEVARPPAADRVLKRLIKKMVEASDKGGNTKRSFKIDDKLIEVPIPTIKDRRAFVASTLGWSPLIYRSNTPQRKITQDKGLTTIYVDVSGSTRSYWSLLASLVRPYVLRGLVRLFVFSEVVDDVTPAKLAKGQFKTTGGTDGNCIWKHATENNFKKIIILTDGYVGPPSRHWKNKLNDTKTKIRVALTPDGYISDLEAITEEIIELPVVGEGQ